MRILKRIIIDNFQCHKKTIVEPAPVGLTVITGPTDHGKSAIVRAIRWLLYNRPQGSDFIRHGQSECKVAFEYEDGTIVQRRRTVSLNQYYVNEELFEGFGNDVPLEVQQATGVYDYNVAGESLRLNVAEQLAGPFLGSSISAPLRAKILGKLAGTEDIDRANKTLGTDIYHAKQDKKRLEDEIDRLNDDIETYNWVEPLKLKIKQLEVIQKQIQEDSQKLELLKQKKMQLEQISNDILQINKQLEWYYDVLPDVARIISGIEPNMKLAISLIKKWSDWMSLTGQINDKRYIINNAGQPERALEQLNEAAVNINQWEKKEDQLTRLIGLHRKLVQVDIEIGQNRAILKNCGNTVESFKIIAKCNNDINQFKLILNDWDRLIDIREDIRLIEEKLTQYQNIERAKNIIAKIITKLNNLSELKSKMSMYKERSQILDKMDPNIEIFQKIITQSGEEIKQAKEKYKSLLKESGICPYCGSKVSDDCLEHVV